MRTAVATNAELVPVAGFRQLHLFALLTLLLGLPAGQRHSQLGLTFVGPLAVSLSVGFGLITFVPFHKRTSHADLFQHMIPEHFVAVGVSGGYAKITRTA